MYFVKEILNKKSDDKESNNKEPSDTPPNSNVDCVDANLIVGKKKIENENVFDKNYNILNSNDQLSIYRPEDYIASMVSDLAYICGSLIIEWQSFIKLVTHNEKINQHLSKIHHQHRCKRFSEFFFVKEKQLDQLFGSDQDSQMFYELTDKLRKSKYLEELPVCQIECASLDGDQNTMPVIFEEKFDFNEEPISNEIKKKGTQTNKEPQEKKKEY